MSCWLVVVHPGADIAWVSSATWRCAEHVMFGFVVHVMGEGSACCLAVTGPLRVSAVAVSVCGRGCMDVYGYVDRACVCESCVTTLSDCLCTEGACESVWIEGCGLLWVG